MWGLVIYFWQKSFEIFVFSVSYWGRVGSHCSWARGCCTILFLTHCGNSHSSATTALISLDPFFSFSINRFNLSPCITTLLASQPWALLMSPPNERVLLLFLKLLFYFWTNNLTIYDYIISRNYQNRKMLLKPVK